MRTVFFLIAFAGVLACGSADKPDAPPTEPSSPSPSAAPDTMTGTATGAEDAAGAEEQEPLGGTPESADRPQMSVEECKAQGMVVGDIGDGAIYRPDYRCPNGKPPIGRVSWGIEGAVCCPH